MTRVNFMDECDILARYLTCKAATPGLKASYMHALHNIPLLFSKKEQQLWNNCLKRPWILPHVDAFLAIKHPDHPIRKKIFIMLGLLETQPDYSNFFLPSRSTFFEPVNVVATGLSALGKIITGRLITLII